MLHTRFRSSQQRVITQAHIRIVRRRSMNKERVGVPSEMNQSVSSFERVDKVLVDQQVLVDVRYSRIIQRDGRWLQINKNEIPCSGLEHCGVNRGPDRPRASSNDDLHGGRGGSEQERLLSGSGPVVTDLLLFVYIQFFHLGIGSRTWGALQFFPCPIIKTGCSDFCPLNSPLTRLVLLSLVTNPCLVCRFQWIKNAANTPIGVLCEAL
jgi:hypothetical protein